MIEDKTHRQPSQSSMPIYFVSDLFYLIVFCHGEIDALQFRIFIPISISYNRKLHYCPTALRCG